MNLRFSRLFLDTMALTRLLAIFLYHFPNPPQTHMAIVRLGNFNSPFKRSKVRSFGHVRLMLLFTAFFHGWPFRPAADSMRLM